MRQPTLVRIDERGPDCPDDVVRFADVEPLRQQMVQHLAQRLAVEPLSGDVVLLTIAAELDHARDVRMLERPQPREVPLQCREHATARADVRRQRPRA